MQLAKTISTNIDSLKRRVVKILRFGLADTLTPIQVAPYGVDSVPIKDMVAVYSETSEKGKSVIVGYLNKNALAGVGEHRTFSTDANGALKFYIWQKANGTCEMGGNIHNLVRYTPLDLGLQTEVGLINQNLTAIAANLGLLNAYVNGLVPGTVPTPYTPTAVSVNISAAKINELKTL
jgi:hypothetical protein